MVALECVSSMFLPIMSSSVRLVWPLRRTRNARAHPARGAIFQLP